MDPLGEGAIFVVAHVAMHSLSSKFELIRTCSWLWNCLVAQGTMLACGQEPHGAQEGLFLGTDFGMIGHFCGRSINQSFDFYSGLSGATTARTTSWMMSVDDVRI